jgi:hypothetical protein
MVEQDGSIHYGTFRSPFRHANILDAPLYSFPVPIFWKRFRLKEWQHFGIVTPTHYFGFVIFDAKFMGVSFFYVYDRLNNTRFEYTCQLIGGKARVAASMYKGGCKFSADGYHLHFENRLDEGFHRIFIDIEGSKGRPSVQGDIVVHEDLNRLDPLVQVSPVSRNRPFYTHKAALPTSGSMIIDKTEIVLEQTSAIALIDEQKTYYPYFSFWKWATAAGYSDDGKLLAFNLCRNMIADDEDFNENCVWLDGKIYCLKGARFEFGDIMKPWKMKTTDGKLDLSFAPLGKRAKKISAAGGLILSDFHQPFGLYNGTFTDDQGIRYPIKNFFGLAEHHITRY